MSTTLITGNTYPVKEQIKNVCGGRATWNRIGNGWEVPTEYAEQCRALVTAAGPSNFTPRRAYRANRGSTYFRFSSGAEIYVNRNGRCEDAPCCGCCSY